MALRTPSTSDPSRGGTDCPRRSSPPVRPWLTPRCPILRSNECYPMRSPRQKVWIGTYRFPVWHQPCSRWPADPRGRRDDCEKSPSDEVGIAHIDAGDGLPTPWRPSATRSRTPIVGGSMELWQQHHFLSLSHGMTLISPQNSNLDDRAFPVTRDATSGRRPCFLYPG